MHRYLAEFDFRYSHKDTSEKVSSDMPAAIDFYGPRLKTERAEHHINELDRLFTGYRMQNENALLGKKKGYAVLADPIGGHFPKHTPTILGDAIHNLRAALDHAYCILVEANGGIVNKHTKFPFTENGTRQDLEGSAKGRAKEAGGPSDKMLGVVFDEIQPYPGGKGENLIKLHVLDIADKHMVLLPTQQRTNVKVLHFQGGGGIFGISLVTSNAPAVSFGPGAGLDPSANNQASFDICFGGGQPFEGQPIIPILNDLSARVHETLELLERKVSETA